MEGKIILTGEETYGAEEKSPSFSPEIKVKFASDISAKDRRELVKASKEIGDEQKRNEEMAKILIKRYILDWNLFQGEEKMPITFEAIDEFFSARLQGWLIEEVFGFFSQKTTTTNSK